MPIVHAVVAAIVYLAHEVILYDESVPPSVLSGDSAEENVHILQCTSGSAGSASNAIIVHTSSDRPRVSGSNAA